MDKNTDISLDLETLGTAPGSVITQIGVCAFGPEGLGASANFYIDPQSCLDLGMTVSWSTIRWWLGQSKEAREAMEGINRYNMPLRAALHGLNVWIAENTVADFCIWGHGSCFDVVLLEDAYRRAYVEVPWVYRRVRDLRTLLALAPDVALASPRTEHVAMDDAIAQAQWIIAAQNTIKGNAKLSQSLDTAIKANV